MTKEQLILAGLAASKREKHTPVQVQKLFFLILENVSKAVGGKLFRFKPYHYGPFSPEVYSTLDRLAEKGLVEQIKDHNWTSYRLTEEGQVQGEKLLQDLEPEAQEYIQEASEFVRSLSFTELVSAIYKAYPKMKANSVLQY